MISWWSCLMLAVHLLKLYYHFWWYIAIKELVLVTVLIILASATDCLAIFVQFMKEHSLTELSHQVHSIMIPFLSLFWIVHACWQLFNDPASIYYLLHPLFTFSHLSYASGYFQVFLSFLLSLPLKFAFFAYRLRDQ